MIAKGAMQHYDVATDTDCSCQICTEWKRRRDVVQAIAPFVENHARDCGCDSCRAYREAAVSFLAMTNRRDLWIESSYHALKGIESSHVPGTTLSGEAYMTYIAAELESPERSEGWWAQEGGRYPLGYWFRRFERMVRTSVVAASGRLMSNVVSGSGSCMPA